MNNNVILRNFDKNDTINRNIYSRNFSSSDMQMNFDPRPVSTKYSIMPIQDNRKETTVPLDNVPVYNSENNFYPGTDKPHFCGFATNVDKESTLRNQFFALQATDQAKYIPSSSSDMYNNPINFNTVNSNLNNLTIFNREEFNEFNPNLSSKIGNNTFNNFTRIQLKNI